MRYLFLIRAHHWVKNLFIFIPAFFAGVLFQWDNIKVLWQGFACFCLASSAIYILNDYMDLKSDQLHPVKKNRPLASGKITIEFALSLMVLLTMACLFWAWRLGYWFEIMIVIYLVVNAAYSFGLKDVPLLDVFLVSSGFMVRTISGGVLIDVFISQWLIIMIFLLSLLLAFAKREQDLVLANGSTKNLRKSCRQYSLEYVHICLSLVAGVIMVSYVMYTMSDEVRARIGDNYLYITSLFVFAGILRYLQITLVRHGGGSPTRIFLTDRFIQLTIAGWVTTFYVTLYWIQ